MAVIKSVEQKSPAWKKLHPGEKLISINGKPIKDVLDYKFYGYDPVALVEVETAEGKRRSVKIKKAEGQELGLEFETYLMDKARSCANRCIFCFVDQLPKGMRETLYFKDDDARLSFLLGNYITLTNLSDREVQRIIELKISPINISVHTTNPQLRCFMLGNRNAGRGIDIMRRFAEAGIIMNCQIVCCPDINDGEELVRSMRELSEMYPGVNSVSIVPVGLTKHREGLAELKPFTKEAAVKCINDVESFAAKCFEKFGTRLFFCSDELYLKAERPLPEDEYYEDYTQLENGVGMLRLLKTEFNAALPLFDGGDGRRFTVATGVSAAPFLKELLDTASRHFEGVCGGVMPVINDFFGHTIDVAGLVTGGDIIKQLSGKNLGERLLIPGTMLRHGEGVFLDDITVSDVEKALKIKVEPVECDGYELLRAFLNAAE